MNANPALARREVNDTRYQPGQTAGHYESFFQRANHPTRPLAFWIRYTLFSPNRHPDKAIGELWAVFFDGERGRHVAVKTETPIECCAFKRDRFFVKIDEAQLEPGWLAGSAASGGHALTWNLTFAGDAQPLFLLPLNLYKTGFPKAKSLVGLPLARFNGSLSVDGQTIEVVEWVGSQNHNWGAKHTDAYAWGQVAGFDTHPESFLEVATARIKIGPIWTPPLTLLVLRHQGDEITLNTLTQALRAKGSFDYFTWRFHSETASVRVEGAISAPREAFVGLSYYNPPGGSKHCLNTKIAACELKVVRKTSGRLSGPEILSTRQRAALEILTDDRDHGVDIRA